MVAEASEVSTRMVLHFSRQIAMEKGSASWVGPAMIPPEERGEYGPPSFFIGIAICRTLEEERGKWHPKASNMAPKSIQNHAFFDPKGSMCSAPTNSFVCSGRRDPHVTHARLSVRWAHIF